MESGTEGGTRTLKVAKPADFESAASTNSATSAQGRDYKQIHYFVYSSDFRIAGAANAQRGCCFVTRLFARLGRHAQDRFLV